MGFFLVVQFFIILFSSEIKYNSLTVVQETLIAAESKREEEKAKGVSNDDASDNPDIVLFEDNEEEEEEDSEEEDDGNMGQPALGRGRGRGGMMWQTPMPMVRGGVRPVIRGFPPVMMGADGFGYPDGFGTPDLFGVPPRGVFGPYGPRFSGDFTGAGLMFPGRPPQPGAVFPMGGFGMMMGNGGRGPFMGNMAAMAGIGRPGRPIGMSQSSPFLHPPPPPPPPSNNRIVKKDQRQATNDRYVPSPEQGSRGGHELAERNGSGGDKFGTRSGVQNDESESEDEAAPRRSRYGEGRKKRREADGEAGSDQWETPVTDIQNE